MHVISTHAVDSTYYVESSSITAFEIVRCSRLATGDDV